MAIRWQDKYCYICFLIISMSLSLFQIVNYTLLLVLLILFIRYLWIVFVIRDDEPVQWQYAIKNGKISSRLKKIRKGYPDKVRFLN